MKNTIRTSLTLAALISAAALASADAAAYCPQQGGYYGGRGYNAWQWRGHAHAKQWRRTGARGYTGRAQGQAASANEQGNAGQSAANNAAQGQDQNSNANQQANAGQGQAGSVQGLSQDQADKIRDALANSNSARVDQANFGLNVGATVPRTERLEPLPSQVATIDPKLTGDKFLIVQDDIVIVDPRTNRVVALIPEAGGTNAAGGSQPSNSNASSNSAR